MTALGLEADLNWVDSASVEHLIGHLYRTKPLLFLPTTTSSSAAGADTTSAAEPQFMVHLDGSAVTVQTALAGQTALTVDPSFDYTDAGDENLTITGSGLGDIIALGSGNNTVIETTGSNIIFVKDAATAGSNTIHGGDGFDTIVGGQGNDTHLRRFWNNDGLLQRGAIGVPDHPSRRWRVADRRSGNRDAGGNGYFERCRVLPFRRQHLRIFSSRDCDDGCGRGVWADLCRIRPVRGRR